MIDYVFPDLNKVDQYNCYQYNCSICDETFKSKNDFEEHTNVCQCASITDFCCSCQIEKSKRKKVENYKPHRFFKPQKDLEEHNNTHHNQENKNKHAEWQNFARCLLCGATDPHSHRPGVFRNELEALETVKGQLILKCPFGFFISS